MIVYKTTNLINGKFYIGKDSKNNPKYLGSGILLNKAINKYGVDNFVKEALEHCSTIEELNKREQYWIFELDAKNKGYNIADGGHGGNTYNEEISKRVSEFMKQRPVSIETRKKKSKSMKGKFTLTWFISEYGEIDGTELYNKRCNEVGDFHRGKTISDEQKEKLSKRMKNFDNYSPKFLEMQKGKNKTGEKNPMWGKSHTDKSKQKMSKYHKENNVRYWLGKKRSDEFNEKRRELALNFRHTDEYKQSISGEGNPFYGCKHTEESKRKISEARKSKTPEQKLDRYIKFFISRTGKEPSNEQKKLKLNEYKKDN